MKCYPVIIPTLNRYEHFKRCIESLAKCKLANETDLIIGLDYPPSLDNTDGYYKIKRYLKTITQFKFKSVIILEHTENYGAFNNFKSLTDYVKNKYEAYIATEDDNAFAPSFLEFMNSALNYFKDDSSIQSVCGFTPTSFYCNNVDYISTLDSSAWGTGTWFSKANTIDSNFAQKVLYSFKLSWRLFINYPLCLNMLMEMYESKTLYGDTLRTTYNILNNTYQIKPSVSLVRNMGHDGSGLHCGNIDNGFSRQKLSKRRPYIIDYQSKGCKPPHHLMFFLGFTKSKSRSSITIIKIFMKYIFFRCKYLIKIQ